MKDTTECSTSASYLDVLLKLDTNGKITTQLYDKRDDFNFSIVNFPYLCSNIPASPVYGVYILQLILYARACSTYNQFLVRGRLYWQISWCRRGVNCLIYRQLSANSMVITTILFTHTTILWATCCLLCFIPIVKPFLTHWSWLRVVPFIKRGNRAHGGDAFSSMAPDPTSDIFRSPCTPIPWFAFPIGLMRLITVRFFLLFHMINTCSR
jgi:hypothetical protein